MKDPAGTWAPNWAPHAVGTWTEREVDEDTGEVEPGIVSMKCGVCGREEKIACKTGNYRGWINRFAVVHYHGDPLSPEQVENQRREAEEQRNKRTS